jgi:Fic family protein
MVRNYRIELSYTKKGTPRYFLVKEIKVGKKNVRARKYLSSGSPPSQQELESLKGKSIIDMELNLVEKAAKVSSERYSINYLSKEQIEGLERLRYLYKSFTNLLTINELQKYEEEFEINYIQGTTSIEGNTLTVKEAYDLLLNDIPPKGKTLREINEVQNFKRLIEYRDKYNKKIDVNFIRDVHAIIMNNIDTESAGVFRRSDMIGIMGCDLRVTPYVEIENDLKNLIKGYYENLENGHHPFEEAVLFHYNFELIHPFIDGNGRVGREIFNYLLIKSKPPYPKLLFLGKDRAKYIQALKLGNENNYAMMISFFEDLIIDQRLGVFEKNIQKLLKTPPRKRQMRLSDYIDIKEA